MQFKCSQNQSKSVKIQSKFSWNSVTMQPNISQNTCNQYSVKIQWVLEVLIDWKVFSLVYKYGFLFQLRSLYSDKEHEGKYTELVRGFLDFDVEMSNIVPLWSNSEKLLNEYNKQQAQLRAKQKMLKEDWERFKAQRRDLKIQMDQEECSSSLIEGIKK